MDSAQPDTLLGEPGNGVTGWRPDDAVDRLSKPGVRPTRSGSQVPECQLSVRLYSGNLLARGVNRQRVQRIVETQDLRVWRGVDLIDDTNGQFPQFGTEANPGRLLDQFHGPLGPLGLVRIEGPLRHYGQERGKAFVS